MQTLFDAHSLSPAVATGRLSERRGCLMLGLTALLAACGGAPVRPGPEADVPGRLTPEQGQGVTMYALGLVGTPYRYGGNTPESGFDCSGLIGHVYQVQAGVAAPRTVAALQSWGRPIPADVLRAGDLVLFGNGGPPTHAGIYVGGARFVHAPSRGGTVRLDRLDASHWARQQIAYRRP
jgi:cell wall-associated NlpC family hydrolase